MKYVILIGLTFQLLIMPNSYSQTGKLKISGVIQNRAPLRPNPYLALPLGSIQPKGWLLEMLHTMKNGSTGKLDELYPLVLGKRNGWLGGDGDVWERGPYWLDGLTPLAYILEDSDLKIKLQPWIEWAINNQMADGYFGPIPPEKEPTPEPGLQRDRARDWWPKIVMLKVLQQYYDATHDQRVLKLMLNYFRYQLKNLPENPLGFYSWWGSQRGGDNLMVIYWLYNVTGEKFLLQLAELVHKQTFDWAGTFLQTDKVARSFTFHGVNLAQGLKEPVIYFQQNKDTSLPDAVKKGLQDIQQFHGQVQGMYSADEMTRVADPNYGSELCTAVEMMFSLENISQITGDVTIMDKLERIAFNALPTQISEDFMQRQYYQQANQVVISRHNRNFVTSYDGTDQCFGLLTGFPCCTCNMHQGWPKFVQNLWYATADNGVAALQYTSSEVNFSLTNKRKMKWTEETDYPFSDEIKFTVEMQDEIEFPFHLRIPAWCKQAKIYVNGKLWNEPSGGQIIKIDRTWKNNDVVVLKLPMNFQVSRWFNESASIERGPLVYALKIEEKAIERAATDHYGSFTEIFPASKWNYGLLDSIVTNPSSIVISSVKKPSLRPWSLANAPIEIKLKAKEIPEWQIYAEGAGPIPYSTIPYLKNKLPQEITLVPYGCTKLRISEFPVVR